MIAPLRKRHRILAGILSISAPMIFALGLLVRQEEKLMDQIPLFQTESDEPLKEIKGNYQPIDEDFKPGESSFLIHGKQRYSISITSSEAMASPDLLYYWSNIKPEDENLPGEVVLIGANQGPGKHGIVFPEKLNTNLSNILTSGKEYKGYLIFYSLAYYEVMGSIAFTVPNN